MQLTGYTMEDITPWEAASGGKAVTCASGTCVATMKFDGAAGWHTINVQYFDMPNGAAHFRLVVGKQLIDEWAASDRVPARRLDAAASARRLITGVALRPGDKIRIEGIPAEGDPAGLDYVEIQLAR